MADDNMLLPPLGVKVKDTFRNDGRYCYEYSGSGIDGKINLTC